LVPERLSIIENVSFIKYLTVIVYYNISKSMSDEGKLEHAGNSKEKLDVDENRVDFI